MENGNLGLAGRLLGSVLLLLFFCYNLKAQQKDYNNMDYKLITSKEGMEYLEHSNKSLQDFSADYFIPSNKGVIYELSNGEIVLIHPKGKGEYPGFIFSNYEAFRKCCEADFFPIEEKDMTWLEAHATQMQGFLKDDSFYLQPLAETLKIDTPFKSAKDCEAAYKKLVSYISSKKNLYEVKQALVHCYALSVSKFLIEEKGYRWELKKNYEVYNPYYYPEISDNEKERIDVISKLYIAVGDRHKALFRDFYWYVTGISVMEKFD